MREGHNLDCFEVSQESHTRAKPAHIKLVVHASNCAEKFICLHLTFKQPIYIVHIETSCHEWCLDILYAVMAIHDHLRLRAYIVLDTVQERIINVEGGFELQTFDSQSLLEFFVVNCNTLRWHFGEVALEVPVCRPHSREGLQLLFVGCLNILLKIQWLQHARYELYAFSVSFFVLELDNRIQTNDSFRCTLNH